MDASSLGQLKQTLIDKTNAAMSNETHSFWLFLRPTRLKLTCVIICCIVGCVLYAFYSSTIKNTTSNSVKLKSEQLSQKSKNAFSSNSTDDSSLNRLHFEHLQRRLPQCVIIGVRKAGTFALRSFLEMHPDVVSTEADEVHYFDREENYALGAEWYRQQMPLTLPDQLTLDSTPGYFHTPEVPERMRSLMSKARLLIIVRDPVIRAISDWYQLDLKAVSHGKPSLPFEKQAMTTSGHVNTDYRVLQRSLYNVHLRRWLDYFSPRRIHIVDGDMFRKDPYAELMLIEEFLQLPKYFSRDLFDFNETKGFYCMHMSDGVDKCLNQSKGRTHPEIDPEVIGKLKKYYWKHNERFYKTALREFTWNNEETQDNNVREDREKKRNRKLS